MNTYKALLLDLDDTLLINRESVRSAIYEIMELLGIEPSEERFNNWLNFEVNYWRSWEHEEMNIPDEKRKNKDTLIEYVRSRRFIEFFSEKKISEEVAKELNGIYTNGLTKTVIPTEDLSVLEELHDLCEIVIATNGPEDAAIKKIDSLKISPYVDLLVASGICGFSKPMTMFYDYAIDRMRVKDKEFMLAVGDSLSTDVLGGIKSGIDTCWYNPNHKENTSELEPKYEINSIKQLIKIVKEGK